MYANKLELSKTYSKGETVATPQGRGEIAAVMRKTFKFPSREGVQTINARLNRPVYIVKFEDRYALYEPSNLRSSSYEDDGTPNQGAGRAIATASHHDVQQSGLSVA